MKGLIRILSPSMMFHSSINGFLPSKCRHGLESNVLRFKARLDTTKPIDMDRRFIISYFLSDDTIAVFEPPVRNSGESKISSQTFH